MRRMLRIVPALAVISIISALILGPVVTTMPLHDYFSAMGTWRYLLNSFGYTEFYLPGVFGSNPLPDAVNGSLWTIKFELEGYILLALIFLVPWLSRPLRFGLAAVVTHLALIAAYAVRPPHDPWEYLPGYMLIDCMLYGAAIHFFRDRVILSWQIFAVVGSACAALLSNHIAAYLAPPLVAYSVIFLGFFYPRRKLLF